jgi:hypothetical protein
MKKLLVILSLITGCTLEAQESRPRIYATFGSVVVYQIGETPSRYPCFLAIAGADRTFDPNIAIACQH